MIEFLAVQVQMNRITLEQIEAKFGIDVKNQVEEKLT